MTARWLSPLLVVAGLTLSGPGCDGLDWGSGVAESQLTPEQFGSNDLVVVVNESALGSAAQRVNASLGTTLEQGLEFAGWASITDLGLGAQFSWDNMLVKLGPVQLAMAGAGLHLTAGVEIPPATIHLAQGDLFICNVSLSLDAGLIDYGLVLGVDKSGRAQATLNGPVGFNGGERVINFDECVELLSEVDLDVWEELLWQQITADLAAGFNEVIQERLVRGLGLDIAAEWSGVVTANAAGTSRGRLEIRAEAPAPAPAAPAADPGQGSEEPAGPLVVSFSVGLETEAHPCVSPASTNPQPTAPSLPPVDAVESDSILIAHHLLDRAVAAGHRSGRSCGDRLARQFSMAAQELVEVWPELSRLDPTSELTVRLWPIDAPALVLNEDRAVAATNKIEVDIYATLDGARVRLASFIVSAEVSGTAVINDGWLMLDGDSTSVTSSKQLAGLFGEPPVGFVDELATSVADALLHQQPLLPVPVRGATDPEGPLVSRDGYLFVPRD